MEVDPSTLSRRDLYWLTVASVVPRPIGWISTLDPTGRTNLAPFSFYGGVSTDPPIVSLSVSRRRGAQKDTAKNLLATKEGVIHVPTRALAERMVATSAEVPPEVDEFELAKLAKAPSTKVKPPRIREAPVALEVVLHAHLELGKTPVDLFLLEIVCFHFDPAIMKDGLPDPGLLHAVARLGGTRYTDSHVVFEIERPD